MTASTKVAAVTVLCIRCRYSESDTGNRDAVAAADQQEHREKIGGGGSKQEKSLRSQWENYS